MLSIIGTFLLTMIYRPCPEVEVLEKRSVKCLSDDDVIRLSESKIDYHRLVKERMSRHSTPTHRSSFTDLLRSQTMDKWSKLNARVGTDGPLKNTHVRK